MTITGNTISNVWDAGIETSGVVTGSSITGNTVSKANFAGIASYYGTSWIGNSVSNSSVSQSGALFKFTRTNSPDYPYAGLLPGEQAVYFKNNAFNYNTFSNQTNTTFTYGAASVIEFDVAFEKNDFTNLPASAFITTGNTLTGNEFGSGGTAPLLDPHSAFIDGGGNKCAQVTPPSVDPDTSPYPLKCSPP